MIFERKANINLLIILRLLGLLLMIEAAFMLVPLAVCYIYDEFETAKSFLLSIAITAGIGMALSFLIPKKHNDMGRREGLLITSLTWVFFSIFGTLPFILGDTKLSFSDSFFETMSGFTTTGVSTIASVEVVSHGILMWRAITHFIGGMGIILFTLAVIPMLNKQSGIQLFNAEVTGITHDKLRPRISHTAKSLWAVYLALNLLLIVLLWIGPMNLFDAVCHSFSAIATGGFSTKDDSIMGYGPYVKIVLSVFMFLAGVNFALLYRAARGDIRSLYKNDTFRWFAGILLTAYLLIVAVLFAFDEYSDYTNLFVDTLFQTTSAITSTGYIGTNLNAWHGMAILIITIVILIGSCAGSTTGGLKVDRFVLLAKNLKNEIYKILHPNAIIPVRVNGKVLSYDLITKAGAFFIIYIIAIAIGTFILIGTGEEIYDAFFAVASCISNNGLGYGSTSVSFADITPFGKWTLSTLMLLGRLELFTVIILFTKAFWSKE